MDRKEQKKYVRTTIKNCRLSAESLPHVVRDGTATCEWIITLTLAVSSVTVPLHFDAFYSSLLGNASLKVKILIVDASIWRLFFICF